MSWKVARRVLLLASAVGVLVLPTRGEPPAPDGWRPFTATWTLSGRRDVLPTEGSRPAAVVVLSGPFAVTSGEGIGRGLLGQVIGFDDGARLLAGRAMFTDAKGDRIFATLRAEPMGAGRRASATITGGTGAFAGLEGSFTFSWQYAVDADGGELAARAVNVEGRTRRASDAIVKQP